MNGYLFRVSSQFSIWALSDEQKQYQRSYPEFPEASEWSYSSDQILVGQPFASRAINEAVNALRSVPLHIAFVQAESELIDVAVRMLWADMVKCAVNAALENGEETFDTVRRHVASNELGSPMIDRLMGKSIEALICRELISMDCRAEFNVLPDFIMDPVAVCRLDRCSAGPPATLPHSQNGGFPYRTAPGMQLLVS